MQLLFSRNGHNLKILAECLYQCVHLRPRFARFSTEHGISAITTLL
jgi:hypothetical protein